MFSSRFFHILVLALAIGYVAHASAPIPGRLAYRALAERQASEDPAGTDLPSDVTSDVIPTSTPPPPEEPETTSSVEVSSSVPTSAPEEQEPTSTPSEDSNEQTSALPQQTSTSASRTNTQGAPAPTSTGGSRTTGGNAEPAETSTSSHSVIVSTSYEVRTTTLEDGTRQTMTSATKVTTTPGLNDDESDRESGMSANTRNTIIGVSVGVGGAIILGALAVVFWRLRGRKKQAEEADGLMAYDNTYGNTDKSERSSSPTTTATSQQRNPFQSTLENYHQPTPVNPSSNF